jgi:transcriptional regulator with PAS, ATPase and Fis domain
MTAAATNANPQEMVDTKRFRADLFYRLNASDRDPAVA